MDSISEIVLPPLPQEVKALLRPTESIKAEFNSSRTLNNSIDFLLEKKGTLSPDQRNKYVQDVSQNLGTLDKVFKKSDYYADKDRVRALSSLIEMSKIDEFRSVSLSLIEGHLTDIESMIRSSEAEAVVEKCLETVNCLLTNELTTESQEKLGIGIFERQFERVGQLASQTGNDSLLLDMIFPLLKFGNKKQTQLSARILEDWKNKQSDKVGAATQLANVDPEYKEAMELLKELIRDELYAYGINSNGIICLFDAWNKSNENDEEVTNYLQNLKEAQALEMQRPGIVKALYEQFGICDFVRYPHKILIDQFEQINDKESPYVALVYPISDWNGAFLSTGSELFDLQMQLLNHNYIMRVMEVEGYSEVVRMLNDLRHVYGEISGLIIGGHGDKNSIQFGDKGSTRDIVYKSDLKRMGFGALSLVLKKGASVVLLACSTGVRGGLANVASEQFERVEITAPVKPTNILKFIPDFTDGFHLRVEYDNSNSETYIKEAA